MTCHRIHAWHSGTAAPEQAAPSYVATYIERARSQNQSHPIRGLGRRVSPVYARSAEVAVYRRRMTGQSNNFDVDYTVKEH